MAGSGKAKYLAGLQSLVQGFTAMDERRRQRLLDNLEREKFEYDKKYNDDIRREKVLERRAILGEKARETSAQQRAALTEQIQRGRITRNLEGGNIERAKRIAFNRKIDLPEHIAKTFEPPEDRQLTGLAAEAAAAGMSPLEYRKEVAAAGRVPPRTASEIYHETEALAGEIGGIPAIPGKMGEASRFVAGAGDLPLPKFEDEEEDDDEMTAQEIVERGYERELMEAKNTVVELIRQSGVPNGRLNAEGQRVVKMLALAEGQIARAQILRDFLGVNPKNPGKFNKRKVHKLIEGY